MIERRRVVDPQPAAKRAGGDYFPELDKPKIFIPSGCTVLDCVLGGGWPLGRIANIVGDKSTGKTLLAIEACANFAKRFPGGKIYYREAEAAFDEAYAVRLGLPVRQVNFGPEGLSTKWNTIEDVFRDLRARVRFHNANAVPGLYIIDSLDALTSEAAISREVGEGSYNLEKPKMLSQMFSELTSEFKSAALALIIISQTRNRIGFVVGEKHTRSGGTALDFYASLIIWLKHIKTLRKTVRGNERAVGIRIQVNCKKNKITSPFRTCTFDIRFGYGIDDVAASIDWLRDNKRLDRLDLRSKEIEACLNLDNRPGPDTQRIAAIVKEVWEEIEGDFIPKRGKYA